MSSEKRNLGLVFFLIFIFFFLAGNLNISEAHILIIGDSKNDFPVCYQEASTLAADLRSRGYPVLDLYRGTATSENILKGMYGADAVIYAGHGGFQTGNYNGASGPVTPPLALVGSDNFIWGIGDKMREGWSSNFFYAPFKFGIPVILLHACFSTGWVDNNQVANPTETIYNFSQMFNGAGANYYATAWNGAEIIYNFLNGASNFGEANNQNYEKITTSTLYNGALVWRNNNGYAAFVGNWSGTFPSVAQTTPYNEAAADAWYHSNRMNILYADANNGNDLWDGTSATWISGTTRGPMKTITAALNALTGVGTVYVAQGTYTENLVINQKINLMGNNAQNTIINPNSITKPIINITNGGSGSLIQRFLLTGATYSSGVSISGTGCTITNNDISGNQIGVLISGNSSSVSGNTISGNTQGVYLANNTQNNNVIGNNFTASASNGIYSDGGTEHTILNNNIEKGSDGVVVKNSNKVKIENNLITSNTGTGVKLQNSNNTTIQANNVTDNQNGIEITENSRSNTVADNTINDNDQNGVSIQNSPNNYVSHNTIYNNSQTGISLNQSNGNTINNGNNISGSNVGINLLNSNSNTITGNTISANTAINSTGSTGNTINNNQIFFAIDQVISGATYVKTYVDTNHSLPTEVAMAGLTPVPIKTFYYLLTVAVQGLNTHNYNPITATNNYNGPLVVMEQIYPGNMGLSEYIKLADQIKVYMDRTGYVPGYASSTSVGPYLSWQTLAYTYSNILDTYKSNNNILPTSIPVKSWAFLSDPNAASFSNQQVVDASVRVKTYVDTNHQLPATVSVAGKDVSMYTFLYLLSTVVQGINTNNNNPVDAITYNGPQIVKDEINSGNMPLSEYIKIADQIKVYMDRTHFTPGYAGQTSVGPYLGYQTLIYMYCNVLDSYYTIKVLPSSIGVKPWKFVSDPNTITATNDQVVDASVWMKSYVDTNHQLPATVSVAGKDVSMYTFLYLLSTVVQGINTNNNNPVDAITYNGPQIVKDEINSGNMPLSEYIKIADQIKVYMDRTQFTPGYAYQTSLGLISVTRT